LGFSERRDYGALSHLRLYGLSGGGEGGGSVAGGREGAGGGARLLLSAGLLLWLHGGDAPRV
jgi:hypothetical protein